MNNNYRQKAIFVLLGSFVLQFLSGILMSWSVAGKELTVNLGWTGIQASTPYTFAIMMMPIAMIIAGRVQNIKGARITAIIGALALGGGIILCGIANTPVTMTLTFGILASIGMGFNNIAATATPMRWFSPLKKGFVAGVIMAAINISAIVYSPTFNSLIENNGLSSAFFMLGSAIIVIAFVMALLVVEPPKEYEDLLNPIEDKEVKTASIETYNDINWKQMIRTPAFYKLFAMLAFCTAAGMMVVGHLAMIVKVQANWESGYLLVIVFAVSSSIGSLFGGSISDKIGILKMLRLAFILQAANFTFFIFYSTVPMLIVGAALTGLFFGAALPTFASATAGFFGIRNMAGNYGIVWLGFGVSGMIGPLTAGGIFDATGSYKDAFIVSIILLLIAVVITFTFAKENRVNNQSKK